MTLDITTTIQVCLAVTAVANMVVDIIGVLTRSPIATAASAPPSSKDE